MATLLFEAIEIITDAGLGVPVSYVNTGIGLRSDGHFALMTDRFTVTTATGDSTRTDWVQGILTGDHGNWTLSRNVDFVEAGAFESVSDFQVGIKNIADFRNTLQANGVYLGRRKVKYYRATSSDGATWNFELRWTGVVDDQPFNELRQSLKCVSASKDIFGTLPTVPANKTTFPLMPDNSQDKMIPIALGRVARSPLINVSGSGQKTVLNMMGDFNYTTGFVDAGSNPTYIAACLGYTPRGTGAPADGVPTAPSLDIATFGKSFVADELKGKYVNIIAGGLSQTILIIGNDKTISIGGPTFTRLYLAENLDVSTSFKVYFYDHHDADYWYCEVIDYSATLIASSKPIYQFNRGSTAPIALSRYLSDGNLFDSIAEAVRLFSLSNIQSIGFPGIFSASDTADNGALTFYSPVIPVQVRFADASTPSFTGFPALGSLMPLLNNKNPSDFYTITITGALTCDFSLDIQFPSEFILKQFDALWVLFDQSHKVGISTYVVCTATIFGIDYIGRVTSSVVDYDFKASNLGTSLVDLFRLPGSYYNIARDDTAFYIDKEHFDIKSLIGDTKALTAYNRARIRFTIQPGGELYTLNLREIGLVGKRSISFSSETPYASLIGELYGNTMDGRVSATDYPQDVVRVLEYLIRNYDEKARPWQPSHAYAAGEFARGMADTGHVFVVTGPGTSSGTEPTWTDTAAATYTDGGVTWKEHHEIPIDTASFDSAASHRGFWFVGRTLTENKASLDYYQQILAQSFLLGVTTPDGKVQVKAWLQNTTPLVAFSETNILPGTLADVVETPVRRLYNLPIIKYDKNPASGNYNKQIAVTNIDKPAFPGIGETVVTGTSLGAFSVTGTMSGFIFYLTFSTTLPHNLANGDFVSLFGNADGFNFNPASVGIVDPTHFTVIATSGGWLANPSTSGTLVKNPVSRLKWQDYVAGIVNYSTAKDLWQQFRNSYLVTKVANPLPDQLGQCEWYFDMYAQDANGKYIFSSDGGVTPEYDLGDAHAAAGFAFAVAAWTAWKKKQATFEVADTAAFSALGLGDCVSFSDAKLTAGSPLIGWIHEKTQLPRSEGSKPQPERFRFGVTLYPEALNVYAPPVEIIESGSWPDTITESGSRTDTYTEGA